MVVSSTKDINLRIKSIKNTKQITKAMELVAASKLTKAKERIEKCRHFYNAVYDAMSDIAQRNLDSSSEYLEQREVKKTCYVVIAGDRGLAGGYNSNIFRLAKEQLEGKKPCILPVGRRSLEYFKRAGYDVMTEEFSKVEEINIGDCYEMSNFLTDSYLNKEFDELYIIYTHFVSVLSQQPMVKKLLPIDKSIGEPKSESKGYIMIEPSVATVFQEIVPSFIAGMLWGAVCESTTSEFGARRTAMESATKNAEEMIDKLSLEYNRARQGSITQEITEIVAGSGL